MDQALADAAVARISLQGKQREETLAKIHQKVATWGLKLPDVPPDPLHFGYHDFAKIGETEFNVNNNVAEGYCGKFMFQFAGQTCPMHHHALKHETFFIVKGRVSMTLEGKTTVLEQGDTMIVNRFAKHAFTALEDSLILECSKPDLVEDSIFEDDVVNKLVLGNG
jgi:quercetin dioxygenase-like cupin family protein